MDRQRTEARLRHAAGRRAWRSAIAGLAVLLAWQVAPATAAPQHNPKGRFLGVVKSARAAERPTPQAQRQAQLAAGNLTYHQGPVMHSNRTHAIYWEPAGFSTTSTYKALINTYLGDVAADSGKHTNVYASDVQYTDTTGRAAYSSSFAGAITATDAYPASACTDPGRSVCLTDPQIQAEVDHVVATHGLPRGLGDIYLVMTPSGVGSCFDSGSTSCAYTDYCAYHSDFDFGAGETLYANQPYSADPGCDSGEQPNGDVADSTTNLISHEHNETITDPLGTGWYDRLGNEDGDKCAWNFGSALGSSGSGAYNQLINGRDYYLQQEWSNTSSGCVLTVANQAPTASFTSSPASPTTGQTVSFDGGASTDSDGTVASYSWTFGDGASSSSATPTHTYATAGTYAVKLTVTDNEGATASVSHNVTVSDRPPVASFTFSPASPSTGQTVSYDGTGSSDPDGTVTGYSWNFGDGGTATGAKPSHSYATAGTYTVTLTVTDNNGRTAPSSQQIAVTDRPPSASFGFTPLAPVAGQSVAFDGTGSSDPDGTVTGYAWDFGDTGTGTGATPSHTYAQDGTYTVTLTVTDNSGSTAHTSQSVIVGTNASPTAAFDVVTSSPSTLQNVGFDASSSNDSDGSISSYAWDFGDGSPSGGGVSPTHSYGHAGTYTVTLTVTDNRGATANTSHQVTIADRPPAAAFTFSPSGPTAGQTVGFDGTGSGDPDGTLAGYSWDFGDGAPAGVGAKPSHTYASPGVYSVTLTVTDDSGNTGAVSHDVSVAQPSSGASPSGTAGGGGASAGTSGALPTAPAGSSLGTLPASGARLVIPSQSLRISATRAATVLVRCASRQRCDGTLAISVSVQVPVRGGHRSRTVVLGRARVSIAALHSAKVSFRLSRFAASLMRSHTRVRVRVAAAVRGAATGHASVSRSVWLLPAVQRRP